MIRRETWPSSRPRMKPRMERCAAPALARSASTRRGLRFRAAASGPRRSPSGFCKASRSSGWYAGSTTSRPSPAAATLGGGSPPGSGAREKSLRMSSLQLSPSRLVQAEADRAYPKADTDSAPLKKEAVDEEPEPLRHLRVYSSYLAQRPGLLSLDSWTVAMIWVRNFVVNLMFFVPWLLGNAVFVRIVVYAFNLLNGDQPKPAWWSAWLASGLFGVGIGFTLLGLKRHRPGRGSISRRRCVQGRGVAGRQPPYLRGDVPGAAGAGDPVAVRRRGGRLRDRLEPRPTRLAELPAHAQVFGLRWPWSRLSRRRAGPGRVAKRSGCPSCSASRQSGRLSRVRSEGQALRSSLRSSGRSPRTSGC